MRYKSLNEDVAGSARHRRFRPTVSSAAAAAGLTAVYGTVLLTDTTDINSTDVWCVSFSGTWTRRREPITSGARR